MARFPNHESDILVLAQDIAKGLADHPEVFSSPPFALADFGQWVSAYVDARNAAAKAQAAAADAVAHKQDALDVLTDAMKAGLRYAEFACADDTQLAWVGWSGRAVPASLAQPSQPRNLAVTQHGGGTVTLDWKPGQGGGRPAAFDIQRRELPDGAWSHLLTSIAAEVVLTEQPVGKLLEFRVLAVNRAGTSEPSNTVDTTA